MSRWTHPICPMCYRGKEPGRTPTTLTDAAWEICCFCQRHTNAGIYYRADPTTLRCEGEHGDEG